MGEGQDKNRAFDRSGMKKIEELKEQLEEQLGSEQLEDVMKNFPAMQMMQEDTPNPDFSEAKETELKTDVKPINISFHNSSEELPDPKYEFITDSGFDLRNNEDDLELEPLERKVVPTGLYFSLPRNMELQIRPKSGLAAREGVTVLNTPGTVDSEYRGEIKVILVNLSNENVSIEYGDKIAQAVINSVSTGEFIDLNSITKDEFDEETTERGEGGFGSTGKK